MPLPSSSKVYFGVDPGQSGGVVALLSGGKIVSTALGSLTERDLWVWFSQWEGLRCHAQIEQVTGYIPRGEGRQPGSRMFTFGQSYGALRMALIASMVSFEEVTPTTWQKALGITPRKKGEKVHTAPQGGPGSKTVVRTTGGETDTQWKNRLKAKAQQLFPHVKVTLNIADALLIAEFCRRKHEGRL